MKPNRIQQKIMAIAVLATVLAFTVQAQTNAYQNFNAGHGWTAENQGSALTLPDGTQVYSSNSTNTSNGTNYVICQDNYGPNTNATSEVQSYWSTNSNNRPRSELYNGNIVADWGAYTFTFDVTFTNVWGSDNYGGCFFQLYPETNGNWDSANLLLQFGVKNGTNFSFSADSVWTGESLTWSNTAPAGTKFSFQIGIYCDGTTNGWITAQYKSGTNYYAFPGYSGSGATLGTIHGANTHANNGTLGEFIKCGSYSEGYGGNAHEKVTIYSMYIKH